MSARRPRRHVDVTADAVSKMMRRHAETFALMHRTALDQLEAQALQQREQGAAVVAAANSILARVKAERKKLDAELRKAP